DMGAIPAIWHKYDNWQLPPNFVDDGWKWLSFPALDDLTNADDFDGDMAEYMLADILHPNILDSVIWKPILDQGSDLWKIQYFEGDWTNLNHIFTSPQGYKFNMSDNLGDYEDLEISGFLEASNTVIHLWGNLEDNWIGYFLDETQSIEDAFGSAIDNIYSIQMQHWGNKREEQSPAAPWIIPESKVKHTVTYGDMLIVQCFGDMDFIWSSNGSVPPHERKTTSYFTFSEQADYVPIFVEFDPENIPDEIGGLVDGECKGASVVEDTLSQICTYIVGLNGGELEFELYYDNKGTGSNLNIKDYFVYNPETKLKEKRTIKLGEHKEYYLVSFKADESETIPEHFSIQNFPNPFNPDIIGTTIQYALPEETEISINIYNIKGQLVKRIVKGMQSPGIYNVIWNGKDETGKSISNGIYFYKLSTRNRTLIRKMILMR
ncbi:MAG: T9SS type A sorting domain-containing protein, partial [Candidatus Cloacimonetes bacterium]|nr:T9SS type A sorting domain-containing protein [Candidatus Cloacimonadota bacterium]